MADEGTMDRTDTVGRFCWVDLAASDAGKAQAFYGALFGWTSHDRFANGGVFTCLRSEGGDVGSLYQLKQSHLDRGVPSHWTPYVRVSDIEETVARAVSLGGELIIPPFVVTGVARIALILDSVGALLGLWQPVEPGIPENAHADD
jgi:predicted enzyme related to lactoylglutathione lyase